MPGKPMHREGSVEDSPKAAETAPSILGDSNPVEERKVSKDDLVNLLNYLSFKDGKIHVSLAHKKYGTLSSIPVSPEPCGNGTLLCRWLDDKFSGSLLEEYEFRNLFVPEGLRIISINPELREMNSEGLWFDLPDTAKENQNRKILRYPCANIAGQVLQNGIKLEGVLTDFSASAFSLSFAEVSYKETKWLNPESPVTAVLEGERGVLFCGECSIIRQYSGVKGKTLVLAPIKTNLPRYKSKEYRGSRYPVLPAPSLLFIHPVTGREAMFSGIDLSNMGISVEEHADSALLLPGMIIPEVCLKIANKVLLECPAQVIYRREIVKEKGQVLSRCGIVFLDLTPERQADLSAFIHLARDPHAQVCGRVDQEELWRFFFESGFIYPSKYASLEPRKEEFKRLYEKLYRASPSIARHFTQTDRSVLLSHISMIRAYSRTWLFHHHAASKKGNGFAGVSVLEQVSRYVNEIHCLPSAKMDYVMCYFREENRFPHKVFGFVAKDIGDKRGSSLDRFSYLHVPKDAVESKEQYQLLPARAEDLAEVRAFYETESGGCLMGALDINPDKTEDEDLSREYRAQGFFRERQFLSLRSGGRLKAVIMMMFTEFGFNLSNLTNCFHVFVLDPGLSPETLFSAVSQSREGCIQEDIPVLLFPASYGRERNLPIEKEYTLWILNMLYGDGYLRAFHKLFKRLPHDG